MAETLHEVPQRIWETEMTQAREIEFGQWSVAINRDHNHLSITEWDMSTNPPGNPQTSHMKLDNRLQSIRALVSILTQLTEEV